jgi:Protein of unknown function (DUF3780)
MAGGRQYEDREGADQPMSALVAYDFGVVDEGGDGFEFTISAEPKGTCHLVAVVQTERGPRRTEIAAVSSSLWSRVAAAAVRELAREMGDSEREKKAPVLRGGLNRMSPLVGRELGVLLIVLMETGAEALADSVLSAWRELAREERWWLYAKAAAPGQRPGVGWRRALFHALGETSDTRTAPSGDTKKKRRATRKSSSAKGRAKPSPIQDSRAVASQTARGASSSPKPTGSPKTTRR